MSASASICQLRATVGGASVAGTCWFAGRDRLVTAAHNVHDGAEKSKKVTIQIPHGGSLEFGQAQIAVFSGYAEAKAKPLVMSPFDFDVALLKRMRPVNTAVAMREGMDGQAAGSC